MASSELFVNANPKARNKQWGAYLLRCADDTLYAGASNDIQLRLERHQSGQASKYTRSRLPVELVYWEACSDRSGALKREAALKRLTRPQKLALIEKDGLHSNGFARNTCTLDSSNVALDE